MTDTKLGDKPYHSVLTPPHLFEKQQVNSTIAIQWVPEVQRPNSASRPLQNRKRPVSDVIAFPSAKKRIGASRRHSALDRLSRQLSLELVLTVALAVLTAILFFQAGQTTLFAIMSAPVNADAGFYLSTARALAHGDQIYKTIFSPYTPAGTFLISLIYPAADHLIDPFVLPILLIAASHLIVSYLVFVILLKNRVEPLAALFTAVLCYNLCLRCEGDTIVLEAPTMIFGLLSLLFFVEGENHGKTKDIFIAGALSAVCFLCKQYGLSVMAILLLLALISQPLRMIGALVLGQFSVLALTVAYLLLRGSQPDALLSIFRGSSFLHAGVTHRNLAWFLETAIPGAALALILYPRIKPVRENSAIIGALLFSVALATALFLRDYYHYLLMLIPGVFIFTTAVVYNLRLPPKVALSLLCLIWFPTVFAVWQQSIAWPTAIRTRNEQYRLSQLASAVLPEKSQTLLLGDTAWSYLLKTDPVPTLRPTYSTIDTLSKSELKNLATQSRWLMLDLKTVGAFAPQAVALKDDYGSWDNLLTAWGFSKRAVLDDSVQLWQAKPENRILLAAKK